jgi:formate--tetrahydrofolate ligase
MTTRVPPDYLIARDALKKMRPIEEIARSMDLPTDPVHFYSYAGRYAKVSHVLARGAAGRDPGRVILVTAMTPTPMGSGKTLTTITLADALDRILKRRDRKRRASFVLRQPSEGPTLGMKGGACGGGYSQVLPMEDINLQFTGDIAAVTQAHNLLWAILMSYMYRPKSRKTVDRKRILWPRAVDLCDRSLREFRISPDGVIQDNPGSFLSRSVITAASELMAVLGLARDMDDLGERLARIRVAFHVDGTPVTAQTLGVVGGLQTILKQAINPNLVQTIAGTGGFIHSGPFANIAHGNSSIVALRLASRHADFVVTEGGFGADLGAQKFFDVVCRIAGVRPAAVVIVCSTRDLKYQGGAEPLPAGESGGKRFAFGPEPEACRRGMENLAVHVENLKAYGVRVVVALNRFATDGEEEVRGILGEIRERLGVPAVAHTGYADGVEGGLELAETVLAEAEAADPKAFRLLYPDDAPLKVKVETIARRIYRADGVEFDPAAAEALAQIEASSGPKLNVVMSKTQFSLSDDRNLRGVPRGWKARVTDVLYRGGAGWATVLLGDVLLMPGMNFETCAARKLSVAPDPAAFGGYLVENLQ